VMNSSHASRRSLLSPGKRKLFLWIGTITYSAIFIWGLYYGYKSVGEVNLPGLIAGEIANALVLSVLIQSTAREYRKNR
jgi:hypothetical protein